MRNKTLIIIIGIFLFIPIYAQAVDGEIYFGSFYNSTSRAYPDGGIPKYIAGVEIGQEINRFRPYIRIETIIDDYENATFHPASVRYDIGLSIDIWKGISFNAHHSCWHPVDRSGAVEEYNLFTIRYRFSEK